MPMASHSPVPSVSFKGCIAASVNDFNERAENYTLVDKTAAITAFLETDGPMHLVLRPRRSGKTITLKMFQSFFEHGPSADIARRKKIFTGTPLLIASSPLFEKHFAKHPVIYLDLSSIGCSTLEEIESDFADIISREYMRHSSLCNFDSVTDKHDKRFIDDAISQQLSPAQLRSAFLWLSKILRNTSSQRVVVLIDAYDIPVATAAQRLSLDTQDIEDFFSTVLSMLLKNNSENVFAALLVGVLRFANAGWLSSLNNLKVFTHDEARYSTSFMFTEEEVEALYSHINTQVSPLKYELRDLQRWYNGYGTSGSTRLCNPWSVCCALEENKLAPYWARSGTDTVIEQSLFSRSQEFKSQLNDLIEGRSIYVRIRDSLRYCNIGSMTDDQVWGLLYYAGYITRSPKGTEFQVPNWELHLTFRSWLRDYLHSIVNTYEYSGAVSDMFQFAVDGPTDDFSAAFKDVILKNFFSFIIGHGERVYHAFVFGVFLVAAENRAWNVTIEEEAGYGRLDMRMEETGGTRGVLIEFKVAQSKDSLRSAAMSALTQLEQNQYRAKFPPRTQNVREYGISFFKKNCEVVGRSLLRDVSASWTPTGV